MSEPGESATERELADYYDEHRDLSGFGDPVPVDRSERLDITISVRYSATEIAAIRSRAQASGMRPTAYIRERSLAEDDAPVDRRLVARAVAALAKDLEDLRRAAG